MSAKGKESVRLFDNKQMVHIAAEVVVLIGITFFFSTKNRKLQSHIDELTQRLEDQEDHLQKLDVSLQQLNTAVQRLSGGLSEVSEKTRENLGFLRNRIDLISAPVQGVQGVPPPTLPAKKDNPDTPAEMAKDVRPARPARRSVKRDERLVIKPLTQPAQAVSQPTPQPAQAVSQPQPQPQPVPPPVPAFIVPQPVLPTIEEQPDDDNGSEEDLDDEIRTELEDLEEQGEHLKKQPQ